MSTDIDWQRELDTSFGSGHDVPPSHYVVGGRGAVRRRRVRASAVGVAAAALVAGSVWSVAPGGGPRGSDAPIATQAPSTKDDESTSAEQRSERRRSLAQLRKAADAQIDFLGEPAALTDHGLVLAPGAGPVLERVPNPMDYTATQGSSTAIRVMFEGREQYSLMAAFSDGSTSTSSNDASGDFEGWLAQTVRTQNTLDVANGVTASTGDTSGEPWLSVGSSGGVEAARRGIVLVEERVDVDLGPGFGRGATRTGAVRLVVDGRTEYAAYRVVDGRLDVIPGGGRFDSISAFLDWAASQYASGQGLR